MFIFTPTKEARETTTGGGAQIVPCWATPWPITGAISPAKAHLRKPRGEQQHTVAGGNPKEGLLGNNSLVHPTTRRLSQQSCWPQSRSETLPMSHGEQLPSHLFDYGELLPRGGTYYRLQGKSTLGLHRIYGIFKGGIKDRTREGIR